MEPTKLRLALVQMQVRGGEKALNILHATDLIRQAAQQGADVALLPECFDLGWTHPSSLTQAEPIPYGQPCQQLMKAAVENNIYVCAGLTERTETEVFNSAVLIDRQGRLLCRHRKLNELDIGHAFYAQGDRLNVAHTEFGTVGLMICADGFAADHVLARSLGYMGADVILSPSSWAVPSDHDNTVEPYGDTWRKAYSRVASEFATAICGVSNVGPITAGPWSGMKCIGCSLLVDASGNEVLQGPYGVDAETVLVVDLELSPRPARGTDWVSYWAQQPDGEATA